MRDPINNSYGFQKFYDRTLNIMIDQYVVLEAAEKDTNIIIDNNMVDVRLNEYIDNLINELGSEENLSSVFNKSIREIKYYDGWLVKICICLSFMLFLMIK